MKETIILMAWAAMLDYEKARYAVYAKYEPKTLTDDQLQAYADADPECHDNEVRFMLLCDICESLGFAFESKQSYVIAGELVNSVKKYTDLCSAHAIH